MLLAALYWRHSTTSGTIWPTQSTNTKWHSLSVTGFDEEELESPDGPIVAVNEHGSDPHYLPQPEGSSFIGDGDWLLIDLWAKEIHKDSVYADITWVAYVGEQVPSLHQQVFQTVTGARDAALGFLQERSREGRNSEGWEADAVARQYIEQAGYGDYFHTPLGS